MDRDEQSSHILMGIGREIRTVPNDAFVQSVKGLPTRMASRLAFMSPDHHVVRDFVVANYRGRRDHCLPFKSHRSLASAYKRYRPSSQNWKGICSSSCVTRTAM